MRKKCVRWAKPVLVTLTIIVSAGVQWSDAELSAQSPDPLTLPRLTFSDFTYVGGFRLPRTAQGDDFSYGGSQIAYNPARNSLFANSLRHRVAEVSIPTPNNTTDVNQMPFASYLQSFVDPSEGHFREIENFGANGAVMSGLVVYGNRLYATGSIYYDAMNTQVVSHFSHSTALSEPSFIGMSQVWETGRAGYVGGYMANIPAEWQSRLGGPALTGQCCIPIAMRTSFGPAAFAWDPVTVGRNTAVPAQPLVYYPPDHTTLGPWEGSNERYGATTVIGGAAIIAGTRTAVFIGRNGLGKYCYGHGVTDPALDGTKAADGVTNCYDPVSAEKGQHSYPYRYQIWAYDLADFAAVKAGTKQPWDVEPYGVWPFDFPTPHRSVKIGGVAYDAQRQLLYVSQGWADQDGYSNRPIIHALKINTPSSTAPPPLSTIATVSAASNVPAPQQLGTAVTWTVAAAGGTSPYQYKWFASAGGVTTLLQDWSTSSTFTWQPSAAASDMRIIVWARSAGSLADTFEAKAEYPFPISDIAADTATSARVSSVALMTNLAAPQPASTSITWTAIPTGGSGSQLFKWFVTSDGGSWNAVSGWSTSNQFTWMPAAANPNYAVSVWVKRASTTADAPEASTYLGFPITEPVATPLTGVALTANLPAPQQATSTIVWTASPAGGNGALVYRWFVTSDGGTWNAVGSWTSSNQFSWTPTVASPHYAVSVWVKRATSAADAAEASTHRAFPITEPPAPVSSVALTTDVPAPQHAGSTIVWSATPAGGSGALVYKWFVTSDGGTWNPAGSWTSSHQFTWTPAVASPHYSVSVWVKRASNAADAAEASTYRGFAITEPSVRVGGLTLATDVPAPQDVSSTIVWTATPIGGTGPLVYKWFVSPDGGTWNPVGSWTPSNQFTWMPTVASANYRVSAWVKRASNPADAAEASAHLGFAIHDPLTSVALTTNIPSPQSVSSTIEWTARAAGGTGALSFRWFISNDDGVSWVAAGPWAGSNRLNWTPTAVNPKYRVTVWVKHATNPSEYPEVSAQRRFPIRK